VVAERARVISPAVWRFPSEILVGPTLEEGKERSGASAARPSEEMPVAGPVWPLSFDDEGERRSGCPRVGTRCEKRLVRVEEEVGLLLLLLLSLLLLLLLLSLLSSAGVVVVVVVVVE
jgi:hypothetical protein